MRGEGEGREGEEGGERGNKLGLKMCLSEVASVVKEC